MNYEYLNYLSAITEKPVAKEQIIVEEKLADIDDTVVIKKINRKSND